MNPCLNRIITWPILFVLLIGCAPASQVAPQPDLPSPTPPSLPARPPTQAPAASDPDTPTDYFLHDARQIGDYTIKIWRHVNDPYGVIRGLAVIAAPNLSPVSIELVEEFGELPASDVTGEGDPDVVFKLRAIGSSHCCWGAAVYNLGTSPSQVLESWTPPYGYWDQTDFRDLNGDGRFELVTREMVTGFSCTQPTAQVVLEYEAGRGYVPASPRFPEAYTELIMNQTRLAEAALGEAVKGYRCGVLDLVLNYLYAGRSDRAWSELWRLYPAPDVDEFRAQIEKAVHHNPMYVQP